MFRSLLAHRAGHYLLLLGVLALLTLPNLGTHSFWDIDESLNAQASREMLERGTWVVPTFNYEPRTAKPAMINWLQMTSYQLFGVTEFSARLPSVLAGLLTVLLTYELARRMFGATTGLLAGLILASAFEFCLLIHAATPDAPLLCFITLSFTVFWFRSAGDSRKWWVPMAAACGLATLTKGPVGVVMPGMVLLVYFAWNRELGRLWDRKFFKATLVYLAIVLPWYILVAVETRGVFIKEFLMRDNVGRFMTPMENHRGPFFYHALGLFVLYAPWCIFLIATIWHAVRQARQRPHQPHPEVDLQVEQRAQGVRAYRFLIAWFGTYLIFFSIAATKLPNYILPLYPALAIMTARLLERWRLRIIEAPRWLVGATITGLVLVGVTTFAGLMIVGGEWKLPFGKVPQLSGVGPWGYVGIIPIVVALVAWWFHHQQNRTGTVTTWVIGAVAYLALLAGGGSVAFEAHKAPKQLVEMAGLNQPEREMRIGSLVYFQPSTVYYTGREVAKLQNTPQAIAFLNTPLPSYLFVEEKIWQAIQEQMPSACQTIARHWDLYKNGHVVVIWNGYR